MKFGADYHREYYYKRRDAIHAHLGGRCVKCGATDDLQIDHIDPRQKSFDICRNLTLSNPAVRAELEKCQLLCRDCHHKKTAKENSGFTHGTVWAWQKKKCPCDVCVAAKWAWHDARNAARRKGRPYRPSRARSQ